MRNVILTAAWNEGTPPQSLKARGSNKFELPARLKPLGNRFASSRPMNRTDPADSRAANLADRGTIEEGKRADLICVRIVAGMPHVQRTWNAGDAVFECGRHQ